MMTIHEFKQMTAHVYWLSPDGTTDRPVLGVVTGANGSLVVDAGNSPAHARVLLDHMAAAGLPAPRFLALTHWHWDHWFGAAAFDVPAIAHAATRRILVEQAAWNWSDAALDARVEQGIEIAFCRDMLKAELPDRRDLVLRAPDVAFTGELTIDLGGVTCRLLHVGGDHAADSVIVHVPEEGIVFLGDCRYDDIYHAPPRLTAATIRSLYDRLLALDAAWYLGGHEPEPIARAALVAESELVRCISAAIDHLGAQREAVLAALRGQAGSPLDEDSVAIADALLAGAQAVPIDTETSRAREGDRAAERGSSVRTAG